jgi:hypothetical protein
MCVCVCVSDLAISLPLSIAISLSLRLSIKSVKHSPVQVCVWIRHCERVEKQLIETRFNQSVVEAYALGIRAVLAPCLVWGWNVVVGYLKSRQNRGTGSGAAGLGQKVVVWREPDLEHMLQSSIGCSLVGREVRHVE